MWTKGHIGNYSYCAKVYDNGSKFGINEGRISKLEIRDANGICVLNYDRGWDIKPQTEEVQRILDCLLWHFRKEVTA